MYIGISCKMIATETKNPLPNYRFDAIRNKAKEYEVLTARFSFYIYTTKIRFTFEA